MEVLPERKILVLEIILRDGFLQKGFWEGGKTEILLPQVTFEKFYFNLFQWLSGLVNLFRGISSQSTSGAAERMFGSMTGVMNLTQGRVSTWKWLLYHV